jgi:hypothetical protein
VLRYRRSSRAVSWEACFRVLAASWLARARMSSACASAARSCSSARRRAAACTDSASRARAGPHVGGLLLGQAQQLLGAEPEAVLGRRVDVVVPRGGRRPRPRSTRPVALRRAAGLEVTSERGVLLEQAPDVLVDLNAVVAAQHQVELRALPLGGSGVGWRRGLPGDVPLTWFDCR